MLWLNGHSTVTDHKKRTKIQTSRCGQCKQKNLWTTFAKKYETFLYKNVVYQRQEKPWSRTELTPTPNKMCASCLSVSTHPCRSVFSPSSAFCLAAVHGWLVASADCLQQLPVCGKAKQQRVRPCQSKNREWLADEPHSGFTGLDDTFRYYIILCRVGYKNSATGI